MSQGPQRGSFSKSGPRGRIFHDGFLFLGPVTCILKRLGLPWIPHPHLQWILYYATRTYNESCTMHLHTWVDHESHTMYLKPFELTMTPVPCILKCLSWPWILDHVQDPGFWVQVTGPRQDIRREHRPPVHMVSARICQKANWLLSGSPVWGSECLKNLTGS